MREWQSLSPVRWYCRYHVVIVPKYRKKVIFGSLRKGIGKILRELCEQEGIELVEGHAMGDHVHVHLCLSVPPKFSVANTVGFLKGKSAIRIHREHLGRSETSLGFTSGRAATV
jgi:putative transposase